MVEQLFLDLGGYTRAKEKAVGEDDATAPAGPFEHGHNILEVEQRCLGGAHACGEVVEDAALLLTAERRVGCHHVYPVSVAELPDIGRERIALDNVGALDAV